MKSFISAILVLLPLLQSSTALPTDTSPVEPAALIQPRVLYCNNYGATGTHVCNCKMNDANKQYWNYCWEGYKGKKFTGDHQHNCVDNYGCCNKMASSWETTGLYSAKVTRVGYSDANKVALFTNSDCTGSHQLVDSAGYRDMTNLPAYRSWKFVS